MPHVERAWRVIVSPEGEADDVAQRALLLERAKMSKEQKSMEAMSDGPKKDTAERKLANYAKRIAQMSEDAHKLGNSDVLEAMGKDGGVKMDDWLDGLVAMHGEKGAEDPAVGDHWLSDLLHTMREGCEVDQVAVQKAKAAAVALEEVVVSVAYLESPFKFTRGVAIPVSLPDGGDMFPTVRGKGALDSTAFTVSPSLPAGITCDPASGLFGGIPSERQREPATFTVQLAYTLKPGYATPGDTTTVECEVVPLAFLAPCDAPLLTALLHMLGGGDVCGAAERFEKPARASQGGVRPDVGQWGRSLGPEPRHHDGSP